MKKWIASCLIGGSVLLVGCEDEQETSKKIAVEQAPQILTASIAPTTLSAETMAVVETQLEEDAAGLYDVQLTNSKEFIRLVLHQYEKGQHTVIHNMTYAVGDEPYQLKLYAGFIETEGHIVFHTTSNRNIRLLKTEHARYEEHLEDKMTLSKTPKIIRISGDFDSATDVPFAVGAKYQQYSADDLQLTNIQKVYVLTAALSD